MFKPFKEILATLAELPCDANALVTKHDWVELATALHCADYTQSAVADLFYPGVADEVLQPVPDVQHLKGRRVTGFLHGLTDEAYHRVFERIYSGPSLSFPTVEQLLKIMSRDKGQIMKKVMEHVVRWVNNNPTESLDKRANNKPLLRENFKPILRYVRKVLQENKSQEVRETTEVVDAGDAEDMEHQIETDSISFEWDILDAVLRDMPNFQTPAALAVLAVFPGKNEETYAYAERFADSHWKNILDIVLNKVGPSLGAPGSSGSFDCYLCHIQHSRPEARCQYVDSSTSGGGDPSMIARCIGALAQSVPVVAANPALNSQQALEKLIDAIHGPVVEWIEQCTEALKKQHDQNSHQSSQSTSSNQALHGMERKHESMPVCQRQAGDMTHGGDSDSSGLTECWSSPPPEELMIKVLQEEEEASVTTTEVPAHGMGIVRSSVSQEVPTSAQPWS